MNPDLFFFRQLDAYYHYKQACLIKYCQEPNHLRTVQDNCEEKTEPALWPFENIEKVRASSIRFIRYHQTETFLTALLGTYPHGPVVAISRNPKLRLKDIAISIAKSEIPNGFNFSIKGKELNFKDWLSYKLLGNYRSDVEIFSEELIDFIRAECHVFSDNSSFVAYKHGCMLSNDAPKFQMQKDDGTWIDLTDLNNPISWVNCDIKSNKISAIHFGAEELDQDNDLAIIFVSSMLLDTLKNCALKRLDNQLDLKIKLPSNLNLKSQIPLSFKMKVA